MLKNNFLDLLKNIYGNYKKKQLTKIRKLSEKETNFKFTINQ